MSRIGVLVSDAEINTISAEIPLDSHAPASDILDCNASTSAHGLLPKLSGVVGEVLRGDGTWGTGGSGAPTTAEYLVAVADGGLSTERVTTDTATVAWDHGTAGQAKATVPDGSITYAKLQDISATARLLGRITAGAGDTEELTGTQATTLLDAFTSALKGLTPASGGGTTAFLRADGTWVAPPAGGSPAWGDITGTLASQTDLQTALDAKAANAHSHGGTYEPADAAIQAHLASTSNPHGVTKAQVGLGSASDTADADKPVSTATQAALDAKAASSHTHTGVYEAANANIQSHVGSAHAPSDAQANADITKTEIEAKLTGEISSHSHAGGGGGTPVNYLALLAGI